MPALIERPPYSQVDPVTEVLHRVSVTDPYRWLEDQESPRTREWIATQSHYARSYLDSLPGRERIRERIRELLDVETCDSLQKVGNRYFFRMRLPGQEQPGIWMRNGPDGENQLLLNPATEGTGVFAAVKLIQVSPNGQFLLYETKHGGERTGTFALLDIERRVTLPDVLPRGYLRGFAFAPDCKSFYFVHEALASPRPNCRVALCHVLGTESAEDRQIFFAGEDKRIRLVLTSDNGCLFFFVYHFLDKTLTDIYLKSFAEDSCPQPIFQGVDYQLALLRLNGKILALTDRDAPNRRIVEISLRDNLDHEWRDVVPERDRILETAMVLGDRIFASYVREPARDIVVFDFAGHELATIPRYSEETLHMVGCSSQRDELFVEAESFTEPMSILRFTAKSSKAIPWFKTAYPFDPAEYCCTRIAYRSKDGTSIPMYLVGRSKIIPEAARPTILTAYGGFGVPMTPRFSVLVAFMMERGCLFALPNIRGGSEFGVEWHEAAKRRKRQTAYDDFLSAAEWLVETGQTSFGQLAIFGGSNSGLLVAAALTQRPDLFAAVICMAPLTDMLRYHLFDGKHVWQDEFGTADDPEDFAALAKYSPYHQIREGIPYPATMIISGDADGQCNPLHARKMTARLQAAKSSVRPVLLDYNTFRGHSPVLPLSTRVEALTDRLAFLCDELQLPV